MIKNCEECKMFSKCPSIPVFTGMIKDFAKEEDIDLSALSNDERSTYINTMLDQWVKYVHGHVTPGLIEYTRGVLAR